MLNVRGFVLGGAAVFLVASLPSCASVAISDQAIASNTARSLGVAPDSLTISDRANDGVKTTYNAKTADGRQYGCYMTGTVTVVGRSVSDPVCAPIGATGKSNAGSTVSCNALQRAAGKCQ